MCGGGRLTSWRQRVGAPEKQVSEGDREEGGGEGGFGGGERSEMVVAEEAAAATLAPVKDEDQTFPHKMATLKLTPPAPPASAADEPPFVPVANG